MEILSEYFFSDPNKNMFLVVFVLVFIYLLLAFVMNSYNKLLWKKGTFMAFVPGFNIFLLGKFILNEILGWILVGLSVLSLFIGGKVVIWYGIFLVILIIVVFASYYKLCIEKYSKEYKTEEEKDLEFNVHTNPNVALNNFQDTGMNVFMPNPLDDIQGMSSIYEEEIEKKKIARQNKK